MGARDLIKPIVLQSMDAIIYTLTILARCFSSFGWKLCIDSLVPCRTKSGRYVDE